MLTEENIREALKSVKYPGYMRDIVSFGLIKNIAVNGGAVGVSMQLTGGTAEIAGLIKAAAEKAVRAVPGVERVHIEVAVSGAPVAGLAQSQNKMMGVKRVVAVASGKGGVGKSTVSVNLACALQHLGAAVGLLDCDIYGPSIPLMMGIRDRPTLSAAQKLVPPANYGVKLMSMGFLIEGDRTGDLARAYDYENHPAIHFRGGMGNTGLFVGGFAARDRGRAAFPLPDRAVGWRGHCDDAAGGFAGCGAQGDCHV